jgi:hypothetical protein
MLKLTLLLLLCTGITATLVNDGCMTPWDVIKQRMQVAHSPYRSIMQCVAATWQREGLAAFYKSYWTTVSWPGVKLLFSLYLVISYRCFEQYSVLISAAFNERAVHSHSFRYI